MPAEGPGLSELGGFVHRRHGDERGVVWGLRALGEHRAQDRPRQICTWSTLPKEDVPSKLCLRDKLLEHHLLGGRIHVRSVQHLLCVVAEGVVADPVPIWVEFGSKQVLVDGTHLFSVGLAALVQKRQHLVQLDHFYFLQDAVPVQVLQAKQLLRELLDTLTVNAGCVARDARLDTAFGMHWSSSLQLMSWMLKAPAGFTPWQQ
eukprot:CAMPEP_0197889170 /NCGR_PEP_ID=MMETSP1439-20131203/23649_1 /TAXON_ID=66791 /ORGANISM="Gonyaulax spinifera, Strain CCMP409" /LENGTH=203 /DNA_ID=CAMNT_0043509127 /DNA_START=33 /DNA_END=645 /DNA_ORIENTATION=-